MNQKPLTGPTRSDVKAAPVGEPWVATFSLLDINSSITSSQMRRLRAAFSKFWRLTIGRFV